MAFNPYEERRDYDINALLTQFDQYKDVRGEECEYVRCDHKNADFSVMDRQQRAYYLYWRDELSRGNCLKSDRGYTKLRVCEIINTDMDPAEGIRELRLLFNSTRMHGMPQSDLAAIMFDYAIAHDMDLPIMWMGKGSVRSFMVTSEIMSYPVRRVGRELMWYLSGGPKVHADGVDNMRHVSLFNDCLCSIDRFLYENTGKGVAQTYSEGLVTELYKVFIYLPYRQDRDYQITFEKLRTDGIFGEFMLGLFSYTRKVLCKEIGEKGPSTPSSFNKEFRAIVDRVFKDGVEEGERVSKEWRGTTRLSMSSKERALMDMGATLEAQYGSPDKPKPVLNIDENAEKQHVSPHLKNDIERNWNVDVEERQNYIPSGFINPDYRSFSEQQRKCYVYWREQCKKGNFGETDTGYLWLYLCELINIKAEPEFIMSQLVGLYDSYGDFGEERIVGKTCFEYALVHKLPMPRPSIYESNILGCLVMEQYLKGKETHPDKNLLLFLSGITDKTMVREFDQDCVGITLGLLRKIQSVKESEETTIDKYCDVERNNTVIQVFDGLKYFKEIRKARFNYSNYIYNGAFDDSLKEIMKVTFNTVRLKRTNKPIKISKFMAFGEDCKDLMSEAVKEWYESKEVAEIKERASNMVLDREAVSGAESALKAVTNMMATEQPEPETKIETQEKETTVSRTGSWSELSERLDDVQKDYLRACLKGAANSFVREKGIALSRMEDSINTKAIDAIGDNIVEDGAVFEEYIEDLKSVILR